MITFKFSCYRTSIVSCSCCNARHMQASDATRLVSHSTSWGLSTLYGRTPAVALAVALAVGAGTGAETDGLDSKNVEYCAMCCRSEILSPVLTG